MDLRNLKRGDKLRLKPASFITNSWRESPLSLVTRYECPDYSIYVPQSMLEYFGNEVTFEAYDDRDDRLFLIQETEYYFDLRFIDDSIQYELE